MIPGDEDKPMSIMERISDAPCEPKAYVDYAMEDLRGRLDYWRQISAQTSTDRDAIIAGPFVVWSLEWALHFMEDLKLKMERPTREEWLAQKAEP